MTEPKKDPRKQEHLNTQLDELEFLREKENLSLEEYEAHRRQILGEQ